MLSFLWEKQNSRVAGSTNDQSRGNSTSGTQNIPHSPCPPVVTASTSGESFGEDDQYLQEDVVQVPLRHAPSTPEALKQRPSPTSIREQLGLPTEASKSNSVNLVPNTNCAGLLPPQPSSSWSLEGLISSPPVSTSSFYSKGGSSRVAQSPNLMPGQARTAVGALVASATQDNLYLPPRPSSFLSMPPRGPGLPLRHDLDDTSVLPDRADLDEYKLEPADYHPLQEDPSSSTIPVLHGTAVRYARGEAVRQPSSPTSMVSYSSSLAASPSSLARPVRREKMTKKRSADDESRSTSSKAHLIPPVSDTQGNQGYDFAPVVVPGCDRVAGTEVVLMASEHLNNLSVLSQSAANDQDSIHGLSRVVSRDDQEPDCTPMKPSNYASDSGLLHQKVVNQRHVREELFVAILERLQDNVGLVQDVETVDGFLGDWYVKTPFDREGVLLGYSSGPRNNILGCLSALLGEMNSIAQQEEYFLSSPTQIEGIAETHDDLRDALVFCFRLVKMAVPESEMDRYQQGSWKFMEGLEAAVGIIPPESPEVARGGDTSVFSLPSDSAETPMTSNVSVTTTITTAVTSPHAGARNNRFFRQPGLQLRRTIEVVAALTQRMSMACDALKHINLGQSKWGLGAEASIRLTEDIKKVYRHVLCLEVNDMKALVDAFEFDAVLCPIISQVSADDEDVPRVSMALPPLPPPPQQDSAAELLRLRYAQGASIVEGVDLHPQHGCVRESAASSVDSRERTTTEEELIPLEADEEQDDASSTDSPHRDVRVLSSAYAKPSLLDMDASSSSLHEGRDEDAYRNRLFSAGNQRLLVAQSRNDAPSCLFSPSFDEIRTANSCDEEERHGYDDLRRQVGSTDYDEIEEAREGPEDDYPDKVGAATMPQIREAA